MEKFYRKVLKKSHLASLLIKKVQETPYASDLVFFPSTPCYDMSLVGRFTYERGKTFQSMTSLYKEAVSKYLHKPFENRDKEGHSWQQFEEVLHIVGKTALTELFKGNIQIQKAKFDR